MAPHTPSPFKAEIDALDQMRGEISYIQDIYGSANMRLNGYDNQKWFDIGGSLKLPPDTLAKSIYDRCRNLFISNKKFSGRPNSMEACMKVLTDIAFTIGSFKNCLSTVEKFQADRTPWINSLEKLRCKTYKSDIHAISDGKAVANRINDIENKLFSKNTRPIEHFTTALSAQGMGHYLYAIFQTDEDDTVLSYLVCGEESVRSLNRHTVSRPVILSLGINPIASKSVAARLCNQLGKIVIDDEFSPYAKDDKCIEGLALGEDISKRLI